MLKRVLWQITLLGQYKVILIHPVLPNLQKPKHKCALRPFTQGWWCKWKRRKSVLLHEGKATTRDSKWQRVTREGTGSRAGHTGIRSSTLPPLEEEKSWGSRAQGQSWNSSTGVRKEKKVLSPLQHTLLCPGHCPFHPSLGPAPCPAVTPLCSCLTPLLLCLHSISCNQD